jgi:PKD repeat protein
MDTAGAPSDTQRDAAGCCGVGVQLLTNGAHTFIEGALGMVVKTATKAGGRGWRMASAIALASAMASTFVVSQAVPASAATSGGMVISELNYHSGSDLDTDDFLELTNTSGAPLDISGWSFTAGVTAVFAAGTVVPANGYFVVAKDAAQFQTTYGFAPNAVYGGNLSNGGEAVTLVDAALNVVDTVTYADVAPWPSTPDGTGPTLELRDLTLDNTQPDSWGASLAAGGTPGAKNSLDGTGPAPVVAELKATPARPSAGQPVAVTARLRTGSTAQLTYKVMFGADVVVPFVDDAASPGGAGDGVYSGTIPGQSAGNLIRYRVDASAGGTGYSEPAAGDSVRYRGVVVLNSAVSSSLPVIEWFMDDAVYNDILANHRYDDYQGAAVWAYNGQVIDGALMNVRGNTSRSNAKVSWKVELPKGYIFDLGGKLPYPLDEFALQNYADNFADVGWATVKAGGDRALNIVPVRTQRNGTFWSLGRIMETEDGRWRDDQGVSNWAIYKGDGGSVGATSSPAALQASGWLDKKTRKDEDFSDVWTLSNSVDASPSAAQQAWIYQNVNMPELVNYMAINSIIRHQDSGWYNWWLARDTDGTGRWEMWQWDLNWIFTTPSSDGKGLFLTPDTSNNFTQAMLSYPEIKEMFYRRLRTLADQFLPAGQYEAQWDAISAQTTPDWNLDRAKWGGYTPASARTAFLAGLADRRNTINGNTGPGLPVPTTQAADANVVVNEIQYHPAGSGGEYIELANPGSTAVDISGWTIDAVGLKIQPGTVIPAGGRVVFVANDKAFRLAYTGANRFVGGTFTGTLDDAGEAIVLRDGSRVVDSVTYSNAAPWPTAADGTGPSLELTSPTADNSVASNWTAVSTTGGTPGLANTKGTPPSNVAPVAAFTSGVSGLTANVNGAGSTDSDGTIASYAWDFGDGGTGTGVTASHTYAAEGTYTVTLTVTDNGGAKGTVSHSVSVAAPPAGSVLAQDTFTRTVTGGLGTAETGGPWTLSGTASNFAVNGSAATIASPAAANRYAYLDGVSSTDTEVRATIGFNRPTASSIYTGLIGRRVGADTYGARVVVNSAGAVSLHLTRSTNTNMSAATVSGLTFNTGDRLQFRLQVTGTAPTTIRAKVWKVGTAEPANWQLSTTDSTATLQSAGGIGIYSYLSTTGTPTPLTVSFDDLWAGRTN